MERRSFLKCLGCGAGVIAAADLLPDFLGLVQRAGAADLRRNLSGVEARYYRKLSSGSIECGLCPRHCEVGDSDRGYCGVRENEEGVYRTLVYGIPCALNIDPIEKKPFFHFHPGTEALSLATAGCNVNCRFCQNWEIAQSRPEQTSNYDYQPQAIVDICLSQKIPTIAYTYSEPTVFYEYMYDIAALGRKNGIRSAVVSNGFIEKEPLTALLEVVDAYKIDLKSIREDYYKTVVRGELGPVLKTLERIRQSGILLEIVTLVVPTLNDSEAEFQELAKWIKANLGSDVPLHFSQFHPDYQLTSLPTTPQKTLETAYQIARAEGLDYVYLGNLPGHPSESTHCPKCDELVIERRGFRVYQNALKKGCCPKCGWKIPGLF